MLLAIMLRAQHHRATEILVISQYRAVKIAVSRIITRIHTLPQLWDSPQTAPAGPM